MNGSEQEDTHRAIERVARESYGRLVAYLPRTHVTWPAHRTLSATHW
jgi:hypothetical protein